MPQTPEPLRLTGGLPRALGESALPPWTAGSPLAREYAFQMGQTALPLYQEYFRNLYGVQGARPAVPLLPEWSGGGWGGPTADSGGMWQAQEWPGGVREAAAETGTFLQEFLDEGDGTGRPELDLLQLDGLGDTASAQIQIESDIADAVRRNLKSQLLGAEVVAFKDLPNEYKRQFRAALFQAAPEAKTLLRRYYSKADYIVQTGRHSYYQNGFTIAIFKIVGNVLSIRN